MTDAQTIRFGAMLDAKRQELVREIRRQTAELAMGGYEHDPIDQVQTMNRRDEAAAMLRRLSLTLSEVDDALSAISEGVYGACVECGEPISIRRLAVIPWASHCIACQEILEQRQATHGADRASVLDDNRHAASPPWEAPGSAGEAAAV